VFVIQTFVISFPELLNGIICVNGTKGRNRRSSNKSKILQKMQDKNEGAFW
jgi:hypothetical protein